MTFGTSTPWDLKYILRLLCCEFQVSITISLFFILDIWYSKTSKINWVWDLQNLSLTPDEMTYKLPTYFHVYSSLKRQNSKKANNMSNHLPHKNFVSFNRNCWKHIFENIIKQNIQNGSTIFHKFCHIGVSKVFQDKRRSAILI